MNRNLAMVSGPVAAWAASTAVVGVVASQSASATGPALRVPAAGSSQITGTSAATVASMARP